MRVQIAQFIEAQRNGGIILNTGPLAASGFPGRVHVTIPDIAVAAPIVGGGWTWQTKRVSVAAWPLVWRKLDIEFDGTHRLAGMVTRLDQPVWITTGKARGHLELDGGAHLINGVLTAEDTGVALSEGGEAWLHVKSLRAAGQLLEKPAAPPQGANPSQPATGRIELEVREVTLPKDLPVPSAAPLTRAAITAETTGAWMSGPLPQVLDAWRTSGGTLEVRDVMLDWAPIHLEGNGTVALDQSLQPMGSFALRLQGGGDVLELMTRQGSLSQTQGQVMRAGLSLLSKQNQAGIAELNVPLTLQDRQFSAGPFPLGRMMEIGWPRIVVP